MKWQKIGKIFEPTSAVSWMQSHASVPFADLLETGFCKIYYSSRDRLNRSSTGYIVIDIERPEKIVDLSSVAVLCPGNLGSFDDSGAMGSCLVNVEGRKFIYYVGWNIGVTVPFRNAIGLAISDDNGRTFRKYSEGPIIDRNIVDPYFTASNCVIWDNDIFKMYYLSCAKWDLIDGVPRHRYHIKYAESVDGINWNRVGAKAIDFKDKAEYAISVPRVLKEHGMYKMWYSFRGESYRIGYAESEDGINWIRMDELAGIDVSNSGWDSEMICYPYVFDHRGARYMLYNGNGYGKTGFGLAVLERD